MVGTNYFTHCSYERHKNRIRLTIRLKLTKVYSLFRLRLEYYLCFHYWLAVAKPFSPKEKQLQESWLCCQRNRFGEPGQNLCAGTGLCGLCGLCGLPQPYFCYTCGKKVPFSFLYLYAKTNIYFGEGIHIKYMNRYINRYIIK